MSLPREKTELLLTMQRHQREKPILQHLSSQETATRIISYDCSPTMSFETTLNCFSGFHSCTVRNVINLTAAKQEAYCIDIKPKAETIELRIYVLRGIFFFTFPRFDKILYWIALPFIFKSSRVIRVLLTPRFHSRIHVSI